MDRKFWPNLGACREGLGPPRKRLKFRAKIFRAPRGPAGGQPPAGRRRQGNRAKPRRPGTTLMTLRRQQQDAFTRERERLAISLYRHHSYDFRPYAERIESEYNFKLASTVRNGVEAEAFCKQHWLRTFGRDKVKVWKDEVYIDCILQFPVLGHCSVDVKFSQTIESIQTDIPQIVNWNRRYGMDGKHLPLDRKPMHIFICNYLKPGQLVGQMYRLRPDFIAVIPAWISWQDIHQLSIDRGENLFKFRQDPSEETSKFSDAEFKPKWVAARIANSLPRTEYNVAWLKAEMPTQRVPFSVSLPESPPRKKTAIVGRQFNPIQQPIKRTNIDDLMASIDNY